MLVEYLTVGVQLDIISQLSPRVGFWVLYKEKSYPLQRSIFLSLAAALVATNEIEVKTSCSYPLTTMQDRAEAVAAGV